MPRQAQLPDDEHVERDAQRPGHLIADRDTTSRQRQDHDVITAHERREAIRQHDACLVSINEAGTPGFAEPLHDSVPSAIMLPGRAPLHLRATALWPSASCGNRPIGQHVNARQHHPR
jgi:hypothetical protein